MADPITIGEELGFEPRQVAAGIPFAMLTLDDEHLLQVDNASPFAGQPPLSSKRQEYIDHLLDNDIEVVNDGEHEGFDDTFARQHHILRLIIQRKTYELTLTADNQVKQQGEQFLFDGDEYTLEGDGLQDGDVISSVMLSSAGSDIGAAAGEYDILVSDAVIDPEGNQERYDITYVAGTMLVTSCPWGTDPYVTVNFDILYSEATSPTNTVESNVQRSDQWAINTELAEDYESGNIGDPFSRGSSGQATVSVTMEKLSITTIRIRATIDSMGLPMENLIDAQTQTKDISCEQFLLGGSSSFTWTAQYFGGAPIGVVMRTDLDVSYGGSP